MGSVTSGDPSPEIGIAVIQEVQENLAAHYEGWLALWLKSAVAR
jgi:hypothetical protein